MSTLVGLDSCAWVQSWQDHHCALNRIIWFVCWCKVDVCARAARSDDAPSPISDLPVVSYRSVSTKQGLWEEHLAKFRGKEVNPEAVIGGRVCRIDEAEEPSDVLWENIDTSIFQRCDPLILV